MKSPDFEMLLMLEHAEPIEMAILPSRCFVLVAQLQLALRHPGNDGTSAKVARDMAMRLQAKLGEIDPAIALALESGWHPEFDMSRDEFEECKGGDRIEDDLSSYMAEPDIPTPYDFDPYDE